MSTIKETLYKELYLKNALEVEGIKFDYKIFQEILRKNSHLAVYHACMDNSLDDTTSFLIPASVRLENGIGVAIVKNSNSKYSFEKLEDGIWVVKEGKRLSKISMADTPNYYNLKTTDGAEMRKIAQSGSLTYKEGVVMVTYSDECALIDKGHDCLFCNINATKARFSELEGHQWKYPKQIGETVKAAFSEGYDHFNITGGFIPERRELEYYLDVAESIQNKTGREDFNGTAVIGAPTDLSVLEQYKEAGYRTVAIHPEVWGKDFFNAICPGKAETGGGYENYLEAIDYAIEVFGKGRVRSQFVAGLQPKEYVIDGLETLSAKGVVALALPWIPNIGSAFEGHRTPTEEWHWSVQKANYEILKKNGITSELLYDVLPNPRTVHDFYRIEEGFYPVYPRKYL